MKKIILFLCVFILGASVLSGCGETAKNEPALKISYDVLMQGAKKDLKVDVDYVKKLDQLNITIKPYGDENKIFKVLNKIIKGKDIGIIYFNGYYGLTDEEKSHVLDQIGKLQCKSIKTLGLDKTYYEFSNHNWTNILPKVGSLYTETCEPFKSYDAASKQKLAQVKSLWLKETLYTGIEVFQGLEELAVDSVVEEFDNRYSSDNDLSASEFTTPPTKQIPTNKEGETKYAPQPYRDTYYFDERMYVVKNLMLLKKLPKLSKLTIAPTFDKYILGSYGTDYLFAITNVRNDLMVNEPNHTLKDNKYIKIDDAINSNVKMITGSKEATIHEFIRLDIKDNYKKSKKYKVKNKRPHLNDKAVVYKVTPYEANFSTKKKYYDNGSIMTSKELDNKIKQPQRAGDYRYFVYVYPVYKYYGKYDKGTKAYTETYYIQVTDLKKKVTYKPVKVATAKPEKKVSYSGTVPKKHSGTVKSSKIDKAIKRLAK